MKKEGVKRSSCTMQQVSREQGPPNSSADSWAPPGRTSVSFQDVSRAQAGPFRTPGRCFKGLTPHSPAKMCRRRRWDGGRSAFEIVFLAPGMRSSSVSWAQVSCSCVDVLLLVSRPLKTLFTGNQGAVNEAARQRVTVGTDPVLSSQIQE